ncbi:MAG: SRPBCC domain-containing protein [Actinomycetota bacterium]|nr:SRPBCC domain-containing protein [Actinomycetota bacterium]
MAEQRPFHVEVVVHTPREAVWSALTDPTEVRRWFGWDCDGLDDEIRYIFVDHAKTAAPDRIELESGETIELEADGPRTVVRVTRPGSLADPDDDVYDLIEEGWRTFLQQLRYYLERHAGEDRRTVYLQGEASPAEVLAALDEVVSGRLWHASSYQVAIVVDGQAGGLVVIEASSPLDSDVPGRVTVTVTSFGLGEAAFAARRHEWESWWTGLADRPRVVP